MYRPCDLDLWPMKVNWIAYNPISILYTFQINISSNSREIKYQNTYRACGNETPITNNSEESNSNKMRPQVDMSRVGGVPPPHGFLNNYTAAKESVVTPADADVSRQLRKCRNSSDNIRCRTETDSESAISGAASTVSQASEASSSDSSVEETSNNETHRDMEYSEAASIPGPWLQQRKSVGSSSSPLSW